MVCLALTVAACGGAGKSASGTTAGGSTTPSPTSTRPQPTSVVVPVIPCPIPASDDQGTSFVAQSPPSTLTVDRSLAPPDGGQIDGSVFPDETEASYLLGPTSETCQASWFSADGGMAMTSAAAAAPQGVTMIIRDGGVGPETDLACPYIPAVLAADEAFREGDAQCGRPPQDVVEQIPTGTADLYAAAVWVPAATKDPNIDDSGDGSDPTVALYTAQVVPAHTINAVTTAEGQMIACTLPAAQRALCTASLEFFLATQSDVGTRVGPEQLSTMRRALVGLPQCTVRQCALDTTSAVADETVGSIRRTCL